MQIPQSTMPFPQQQTQQYSPELIEKLLAQQNNTSSFSVSYFVELFKTEMKLAIAIFVVLFITQTERFNVFAQNNFNIIKIPYIIELIKAIVSTIAVVIFKKVIS